MSKSYRTIPNPLTTLRFLLIPVLWGFALMNWPFYLGGGLGMALLTDAFDGRLARRFPQFTNGKYDSRADKLLMLSVVFWLVMLRPQIFSQHPLLILIAALIYLASLLTGWLKFGRISSLHLYSGRLGGIMQAIFVLHAFLSNHYSVGLFYVAIGLFIIAASEELLIQLTQTEIDEDATRSIVGLK